MEKDEILSGIAGRAFDDEIENREGTGQELPYVPLRMVGGALVAAWRTIADHELTRFKLSALIVRQHILVRAPVKAQEKVSTWRQHAPELGHPAPLELRRKVSKDR